MQAEYAGNRTPFFYGPEGRLIQVDSALEAVRRGSTTLGLKTDEFAVLASHVKPTRPLMQPSEKIYEIDENTGATGSGYIGDMLRLIDEVRVEAQRHRLVYENPVDVLSLTKHLGSYLHTFTLYAIRPPGASLILAGKDELGIQLYQVDPGGTYFNGQAMVIGSESEKALELLQKEYKPMMTLDEGVKLAEDAIGQTVEGKAAIEYGVVRKDTGLFEKLKTN